MGHPKVFGYDQGRAPAHLRWRRFPLFFSFFLLTHSLTYSLTILAAQLPSLFRGVVVADSELGVRVVSVEEASQAALADLRPEDIIVRVESSEVHSIDEFAALSAALKGRATSATVVVFRNGTPRELTLHLYSYPVLNTWGLQFVPEHDVRFAQPQIGLEYWARLGRGFEEAGKPAEALGAYLNALHNAPQDVPTALKAGELFFALSRQRLAEGNLADGIAQMAQSLTVLEKLFDYPLTDDQLQTVRRELQETLRVLRETSIPKSS